MNKQVEKTSQGQSDTLSYSNEQTFDFEQWVKQVRPQLIASLQKRGSAS
jgi:hypothetical protein